MWYLFSLFSWCIGTIILKKIINIWIILFFIFLGISINFLSINYHILAIGRTVTFYPYFLLGYLYDMENIVDKKIKNNFFKIVIIILLFSSIFIEIPNKILWGTYPYESIFEIKNKILFYFYGFIYFIIFLKWIPNKRYNWSFVGENTNFVYLWHLFLILIVQNFLVKKVFNLNIITEIFISLGITILLAYINKIVRNKRRKI